MLKLSWFAIVIQNIAEVQLREIGKHKQTNKKSTEMKSFQNRK